MQNRELISIIKNIEHSMQQAFSVDGMYSLLCTEMTAEAVCIREAVSTHILCPCLDIMRRGGKRLRPVLAVLLTQMLVGDEMAAYEFAPIIEGIHTASLIHDDIEDGSVKRRGETSCHVRWGVDVAINAASALYFFALHLIETQKASFKLPLYKACTNALSLLHLGQAMDIKYHSNYSISFDYETYKQVASLKTGKLFSLAMQAAYIFSYKEDEGGRACHALEEMGVAFQMFDDLANVSSGNKGKDRGDDVVEGKWSFPVVLFVEKAEENKECILKFFEKAKKEGIESKAVSECCTLLEKSGVVQEGLIMAKDKMASAFATLEELFGSSLPLDMIRQLFEKNVENILKDN